MYRVMWGPANLEKISRLYDELNDTERERLMVAIELLDRQLARDPMALGESRDSASVRVAIELPLTVVFRVDETLRVVQVSGVSYFESDKN
jgi:hypothetical protein